MTKRLLATLAIMLVILAGLSFVKFKQIQTAIAQGAAFQPPVGNHSSPIFGQLA